MAIGLVNQLYIMVTAIVIAVIFMMIFFGSISKPIKEHPTIKILALNFHTAYRINIDGRWI